jgi:hypothetical protein
MEHPTGPAGIGPVGIGPVGIGPAEPDDVGPAEAPDQPAESRSNLSPEPVGSTGEPRVDAALALLDRLPELPVSEHAELFEQVHAQLSDVLGELDSGPAGPAGG